MLEWTVPNSMHNTVHILYCTMENDSKEVISMVTVDKRETVWNSIIIKKKVFIRTSSGHGETWAKYVPMLIARELHSSVNIVLSFLFGVFIFFFISVLTYAGMVQTFVPVLKIFFHSSYSQGHTVYKSYEKLAIPLTCGMDRKKP